VNNDVAFSSRGGEGRRKRTSPDMRKTFQNELRERDERNSAVTDQYTGQKQQDIRSRRGGIANDLHQGKKESGRSKVDG